MPTQSVLLDPAALHSVRAVDDALDGLPPLLVLTVVLHATVRAAIHELAETVESWRDKTVSGLDLIAIREG